MSNIELMDRFTKEAVAVCDAVAAKRRSAKRIMLSFDEWNVWYKARSGEDMAKPGWPIAPRLIEEVYDLQDALMVGGALITLLNNADRVKVACQAQLVNALELFLRSRMGRLGARRFFTPSNSSPNMLVATFSRQEFSRRNAKRKLRESLITSLRQQFMTPLSEK